MLLVDQTVGDIRRTLESMQAWDQTLIILTSDHWQRDYAGDHLPPLPEKTSTEQGLRIPLLVKFPGQKTPVQFDQRFSNIAIRGWVEDMARGQNPTPDQASKQAPTLPANLRTFLMNPQH
jgi:arylsulfatase A-like enzyme